MRILIVLLISILIPFDANAAADKVYISSMDAKNAVVPEGKLLWIDGGETLSPLSSFKNLGSVLSYGLIDLSGLDPSKISSSGTIDIRSNDSGIRIKLANSNQLRKLMAKGMTMGDGTHPATLEISDLNLDMDEFFATREPTDIREGRLKLNESALIKAGKVSIFGAGNQLGLGWKPFDEVFANAEQMGLLAQGKPSKIATLKSADMSIVSDCPPQNPIKVASGNIHATEKLKIGRNGERTLQLLGGILTLGDMGSATAGKVDGNIEIGSNSAFYRPRAAMFVAGGKWEINGNIFLTKDGYFHWNPGSSLSVGKNFKISGCDIALENANLTVKGTLSADAESRLNVLDSGRLIANKVKLNGGKLGFDPEFLGRGELSNASMGALSFEGGAIDGSVSVGRNSMVTFGDDDPDWLKARVSEYQSSSGKFWGGEVTAALAIRSPHAIAPGGGLMVDGNWTTRATQEARAGSARFADKSLLVVDAARLAGRTALTGGGTADLIVESGARLLVVDARAGDTVSIASGFKSASVASNAWIAESTNPLLVPKVEIQGKNASGSGTGSGSGSGTGGSGSGGSSGTGGTGSGNGSGGTTSGGDSGGSALTPGVGATIVFSKGNGAKQIFPHISGGMAAVLDRMAETGMDTFSQDTGTRFLSRAIDSRFLGKTGLTEKAIESAARLALAGGIPQMSKMASNALSGAMKRRNTRDHSAALWIEPLYSQTSFSGMKAGELSYNFDGRIGGLAIGANFGVGKNFKAGAGFGIGGGYGKGEFLKTTNNMSFWGTGAYAGWFKGGFSLNADFSFLSSYNKLRQEIPSEMLMSDLKSDVKAITMSAGIEAKHRLKADSLDIAPHAGVRFINIHIDPHKSEVARFDASDMNIWEFPVGIEIGKEFKIKGWRIKPFADFTAIPCAGNTEFKSRVKFGQNRATLQTHVFDPVTFGGSTGIDIKQDFVTVSLRYEGQFGIHSLASAISGSAMIEF